MQTQINPKSETYYSLKKDAVTVKFAFIKYIILQFSHIFVG